MTANAVEERPTIGRVVRSLDAYVRPVTQATQLPDLGRIAEDMTALVEPRRRLAQEQQQRADLIAQMHASLGEFQNAFIEELKAKGIPVHSSCGDFGYDWGVAEDRLTRYNQKRDFSKTTEPPADQADTWPGDADGRTATGSSFVVQRHAARSLHYDFRLEVDDTILSWAVPKGPSYDPKTKRFAVRVPLYPRDCGTHRVGAIRQPPHAAFQRPSMYPSTTIHHRGLD
jgi:hypothetical protein